MPEIQDIPAELAHAPFDHAFEIAEEAALSPQERLLYEVSLKSARDAFAEITTAREEGREEGLEEGRRQQQETSARVMLARGLTADLIAEATGLTVSQINQLK